MFNLFQKIFDISQTSENQYPDWLIDKAIDRAVDGLDARLRVLSGYKKKLRPGIICAIEHVVNLVDELSNPINASRNQYGRDPYVTAFFASANELQYFFSRQRTIWSYLDELNGQKPEHIIGLLTMVRIERGVFGMEMEGDMLRRDVPQVTVNFADHQFVDPNGQESETRRLLKHRAFDHLIQLALRDLMNSRIQRQALEQHSSLLRRKLATFEKAGVGLDVSKTEVLSDQAVMQHELDEIENQLKALPAKTELLHASLEILVDVFTNAPQKLWSVPVSLIIDRMNIKRDTTEGNTNELLLHELHSANGVIKIGALVSYPTAELLPRKKFLSDKSTI